MDRKAEEDEIIAEDREKAAPSAPDHGKSKRPATDGSSDDAAGFCDSVIGTILAHQPARTAVACMALSRRHRRLIRSREFRSLRRLGAPLPRPHIAYVAKAPGRLGNWGRVSDFHGFHVAGAGLGGGDAPMRALAGVRYLKKQYISTCNGVVLLAAATKSKNPTCVRWNPAVADADKELAVPCPSRGSCRILGLGYGRRSETYKLLLWRRWRLECEPPKKLYSKELLVYTLGGAQEQPRSLMSLYLDGIIYILHDCTTSVVIAFDVDDETVTTIDMPGERDPDWPWHARAALWLLTADRRWEQRCVLGDEGHIDNEDDGPSADRCKFAGVWDCGGVLAMYLDFRIGDYDKLCMYHVANGEMFKAELPRDLTPEREDFALCWATSRRSCRQGA
ncbi:uncharacterized protein C2845_PM15G20230 [Panicum miliaceum]|uniref:F-box associated domain-containing protein n=1 Tax=Panicum miliaceum TaxID=4540 RepID=A0A3L6Q7I0_PANMI|nr:uncharacterized protein C2845_PM15G20230 [Panicum miliaceum]